MQWPKIMYWKLQLKHKAMYWNWADYIPNFGYLDGHFSDPESNNYLNTTIFFTDLTNKHDGELIEIKFVTLPACMSVGNCKSHASLSPSRFNW